MSGKNRGRNNHAEPAPPAVIIVPPPRLVEENLAEAMRLDLLDVLGELQVRPEWLEAGQAVIACEKALADEQIVLLMASDLLNPGMSLLDGMLAPLEDFHGVMLPGIDGSCLALSLAADDVCEGLGVASLVAAIVNGRPDAGEVAGILADAGLMVFVQPPWYRGCDRTGRICAMAHMRALEIMDDDDFLAQRTQVALKSFVG